MKKVFYVGIACAVPLLVLGCKSTNIVPFVPTNNESAKFEILGEVRYESSDRIGYTELLRAARNIYPDCDYVIDVMVDHKTETTTKTIVFFML
jgi:hypothetical protein